MLGALVGEGVAALLGQGFLGQVLAVFQALAFHADVLEQGGVAPALGDEKFLHLLHAQPGDEAEAFAAAHLVHHLQVGLGVAPGEVQAAGAFQVEDAALEALHGEGAQGAVGDGADAVGIAVEVQFQQPVGIEDAAVGAQAGGVLVFRAFHGDHVALVGSRAQDHPVGALGAGHGTSVPAAVHGHLGAAGLPDVGIDLVGIGMGAELEVVGRQQVIGVHDLHDMGGAVAAHLALGVVIDPDFLVQLDAGLGQGLEVGGVVHIALDHRSAADQGPDPLVPEHGAQAAAAGLLEPDAAPALVPPGEVEHADEAVVGAGAGGHHRDVGAVVIVFGIQPGEDLGQHVAVHRILGRGFDPDEALLAIDEEDHVLVGLALEFQGVEAGKLEQGPEVAAHVGVDGNVGLR